MSESVMLARTGQECSQVLRMGSKWSRPWGLVEGTHLSVQWSLGLLLGLMLSAREAFLLSVRTAPAPTASDGHTTAD